MNQRLTFTSFDRTKSIVANSIRPKENAELLSLGVIPMIARGAGLSYCAASMAEDALVVDVTEMNLILDFNQDNKRVIVEGGISIGTLNNFLRENGCVIPILPGYPTITIGGCVAFNIHGKSSFHHGTFASIVAGLTVYHPQHGEVICSTTMNKELFDLTIGGMGLTGIILKVELIVQKLPGGRMTVQRQPCMNLEHAVELMVQSERDYEFVYSWNDLNLAGKNFGRGFVYLEKYSEGSTPIRPYKNRLSSSSLWMISHSDLTIRWMCQLYSLKEKLRRTNDTLDIHRAAFPIYGKEIYYAMFGKSGFREYQVIFPLDHMSSSFSEIQNAIKRTGAAVALGSLKLFHGTQSDLRFDGKGVCLAMDLQNSEKALQLMKELDAICKSHRGVVNISKDSRIEASLVRDLFPEYEKFRSGIRKWDPDNLIRSEVKSRLEI